MKPLSASALALAVACAVAAPASAVTLEVARRSLPREVTITGTHLEVDTKTDRVRVAVDYFDASFEGSWSSEHVTVPGLVFDRLKREVHYEADGSSVTCAVAKKSLWTTSYPLADGCRITVCNEADAGGDELRGEAATVSTVRLFVDEPQRAAGLKR